MLVLAIAFKEFYGGGCNKEKMNLEIINLKDYKKITYEIPQFKWIGFNKQNTKLGIVDMSNKTVFKLATPIQENIQKNKKTLAEYFYKQGICKPDQLSFRN